MAKHKTAFFCQSCGTQAPRWAGQCTGCGAWNTLAEEITTPTATRYTSYVSDKVLVTDLSSITPAEEIRYHTGLSELDLVLGGGLVSGSVVLIGGDPGIGKSTLLLQTLAFLSQHHATLYVTGEESLQQVSLRAHRLGLEHIPLKLFTEIRIENILHQLQTEKAKIVVIDSIQTMHTESLNGAPGTVTQVREGAMQLVNYAKRTGTSIFLVGHVTKEGVIAGPRVLEHMVDTVLYFEGDNGSRFRLIRAVKNRFGAVNELGFFAMTDKGLKEVTNPSAIFLSRYHQPISGSVIMASWEGNRPILVEVQALVDDSTQPNPRRITLGLESNRLSMLLAVLHKHGGIPTANQDVFANVVGGVKITETGIDLALLLAVLSSLRNRPISPQWIVFGEVGLSGEIRPVQGGMERLRESAKHGFTHAIVPFANAPKTHTLPLTLYPVHTLSEAIELCRSMESAVNNPIVES